MKVQYLLNIQLKLHESELGLVKGLFITKDVEIHSPQEKIGFTQRYQKTRKIKQGVAPLLPTDILKGG